MSAARGKTIGRLVGMALLGMGIGLAIWQRDKLDAEAVEGTLDALGVWAPVAFIVLYTLAAVFFAPGSVLTLTGGAVFGPVLGTVLSLIGATLGATAAFLIARYFAGDWVTRKTGGRLEKLVEGVESEGWRFLAFVRLVPIFPYNLLNYAFGLTRISLGQYVIGTLVCMIPACAAYSYLGHAGREALTGTHDALRGGLLALGFFAAVIFLVPIVARRVRRNKETPTADVKEDSA